MKKNQKEKGFTLIELLLVIAIIGILAAVLFVGLSSQRDRARVTAFKEQMRSFVPAATICRDAGGTISATPDANVCSEDTAGTGKAPHIKECNGSSDDVTVTVTNGNTDEWKLTATCTRSDGEVCDASCDVNGCVFGTTGNGCN